MAGHADCDSGDSGLGRGLHLTVAESAIQAKVLYVRCMRERDRLLRAFVRPKNDRGSKPSRDDPGETDQHHNRCD